MPINRKHSGLFGTTGTALPGFGKVALVCLMLCAVVACGKSDQKSQAPAPSSDTQAAAPAAPPSPEEALLRAGVENNVYLDVNVNNQGQYCEPLNDQSAAYVVVPSMNNRPVYITKIDAPMTEHDAVMQVLKPTLVSQSTGLISGGTCWAVDPALVQRYMQPGVGMWIPVGTIKMSMFQFVNEYQDIGGRSRSYHIGYIVNGDAAPVMLDRVTGAYFLATCVLRHNDAENRWDFGSCGPTN